ncbi:MAG: nitrophenyl compound nitroreductase subunit ArsF family protein [Macellibacteroides fermentans]|uniref:nitrophenyl compound nitroreductase subunit ArsF family protein n=1 Tax=Macellibacteroides fermentans TaxID=879969 RepID=UPI003AD35444
MKNLFYTLIAALLLISCGNSTEKKTETASTNVKQADRIEVLYFHGAQRCVTCKAIETNTKALLDSLYSNEIASGKIVYKIIDISQKENEKVADKYEVTWSSLFVNRWKNGTEEVNNMTEFGFANAKNDPDNFKNGIKSKIDELLK